MARRLVDRVLAGEAKSARFTRVLEFEQPIFTKEEDWKDLASPVIAIDNVVEYFYKYGEWKKHNTFDMPNLAPPFPTFWLDANRPHPDEIKLARGVTFNDVRKKMPPHWTIFVYGVKIDKNDDYTDKDTLKGRIALQDYLPEPVLDDTHWLIECSLFVDFDELGVLGPLGTARFQLNRYGIAQNDGSWIDFNDHNVVERVSLTRRRIYQDLYQFLLLPGFFAISLLHCKNVSTETREPNPRQQKSYRRKHGGREMQSYHVLLVDPLRPGGGRGGGGGGPGEATGTGSTPGLHICRGHFKDFRENGLFGQHFDIYWWDQHLRGDADQGLIAKDYALAAPND